MKQTTKKIIAREFLFLLGTTVLYLLLILPWIFITESNQEKTYKIQRELESMTEIEKLPFRLKVIVKIADDSSVSTLLNYAELVPLLKSEEVTAESVYLELLKDKKITLTNPEFKREIEKDVDSEKYLEKIIILEKDVEARNKLFFNQSVDDEEAIALGIFIFSVLFPLRYLIYITKWSIKQIKE
ncbi:hypothetical protein SAMN05443667_105252 [Flavobacterium gillisiae]|uniref:Uncharacterized protein n=1 Tax=Flavobacterium gillisiae TaxID=150146 RepID=A0A1H4C7T0_9FLAO|nr:hypothetical protein [Flavobacterium gillisiae]SEA56142.1 hypothetical protein SAMN05443667_105252 [Flavobacterium gillisiae]